MDSLETSTPVGRIDSRAPPRPARSVDDMRGYGTMRASRDHQHETMKPSLSSSPAPTQLTTLRNFGGGTSSSPAADSSPLSSSLSSSGTNRPTPPPKPRVITSTMTSAYFAQQHYITGAFADSASAAELVQFGILFAATKSSAASRRPIHHNDR
ncbi:uncharacterized protein ACA1_393580 [Acanthamoeba castellanii str. Neff]|uniref:Uncharacterized protein n=1 Tax=Acanthamoeba castellanii (strain ATCC 30010 / Neff) TaxID=1257118 RepID=L8H0D8_ACACF|nr:uncharacterized protein ACA1_393580 [Acanthamoeba castellanii str. Neff]ELR18672.1 hypothetical protein ACA1_393580 [Acanthamoeba castellanii str. Neff]